MSANRKNGTADLEKLFRRTCARNDDNISIIKSEMVFTYVAPLDVKTIREYGWSEYDLGRMMGESDGANQITRLAAWIRECGDAGHGVVIEDDPYMMAGPYGCNLDEDGNWVTQEGF